MSHLFYDFGTLQKGSHLMVQSIKRCYSSMQQKLVGPQIQPGFLRSSLSQVPPEDGKPIQQVIESTQKHIFPGIMSWQSPKYFGYFPSTMAVSNVMAEMFASTFHSPAFNYSVSPSHSQLENVQMDWTAIALGLPDCYLLRNSGGGIINNSTTQSVFVTVHSAKRRKMTQLGIDQTNPQMLKFVGYFSQIAHNGGQRGLLLKEIHYRRSVRVFYDEKIKNYVMDLKHLEELIQKDLQAELIPFWFGATHGSTLSGSKDLTQQLIEICKKHKMWINLDAAWLGSTWICPEYRLPSQHLQAVDSICLNFSKCLMLGTGGSVMFVKDKKQLNQAFGGTQQFNFYNNKYSQRNDVVDYKDWIIGLNRRNNSIKFYFLFEHYGLKTLRNIITETQRKANLLQSWIEQDKEVFQMYIREYGLVSFKVKDSTGKPDNQLTKQVSESIRNIKEGYLTPGSLREDKMLRFVIGNYHSTQQQIKAYYLKIKEVSIQLRESYPKTESNK